MFQRFMPLTFHRQRLRRLLHACMVAALLAGLLPPPLITSMVAAALPAPAAQTLAQAIIKQLPQPAVAQAASNLLSGHAFRDFNLNGVDDGSGEPGIANIIVTVYNEQGTSCTTTTAANGGYAFDLTTCNSGGALTSASGELRVEFTLPANGSLNFLQPGAAAPNGGSPTTVQFLNVASGSTTNIDVGFNDPSQYTQLNPPLVTNQYVGGSQTFITGTLLLFPYTAGCVDSNLDGACDSGSFDNPTASTVATSSQVGATWGLTYQRSAKTLFASAFMKRHVGFQQHGKTGVIYKIQNPQGTPITSAYVDLDSLGFDTGTDTHPADNAIDDVWQQDDSSWDAVGKVGLGGLSISADDQTLWTVNLFDRKLYAIPIKITSLQSSDISTYTIPNPCSTSLDFRPFATAFQDGKVYVGVTCTGESSAASYTGGEINAPSYAGNRSLLSAYVYSFDPTNATFTQQLTVPLTYPRKDSILSAGHKNPGAWNPWVPTFIAYNNQNASNAVDCSTDRAYPQPWLTDIEFDNGNMVLGIRDRFGDQTGFLGHAPSPFIVNNTIQCQNSSVDGLFSGVGVGDTLRACGDPTNGWTLENNAICGGVTTAGTNNGDGLGGGEYYYQDDYNNFFHNDVGLGGLSQIPGQPNVVSTMTDPQNSASTAYDGGIFWLNNATGTRTRAYRLYNTTDDPAGLGNHTSAKANGLGDLEALFAVAPIEIGNRIWQDLDGDGIQDPGEPPLSGIQVSLQSITGTIATATTDANGSYYFSSATGTNTNAIRYGVALSPNTTYTLTVPTSVVSDGQNWRLTTANVNSGANGDLRDSDANPTTGKIALTTGSVGANNHTYDFGFKPYGKLVIRKVGPQVTNCASITQADQADPNLVNNAECASTNLNNGTSGQRFAFTDDVLTTNGVISPTFTLAIGEVVTFTNVISGAYNVTETLPTHWQLVGATCSNGDTPTSVHIGDAATVTCTFTNTVLIEPAIVLKKYTNGYDADTITGPYLKTGDVVTWTYVITNTGNVTLTNITLTDDKLGGVNCPVNSLAPNATTTCTTTGIAGVGQYTNTAIVTGTNSLTPTQQVTSTNPSHYFGANPALVLKKYTNGYDADTLSDARPHLKLGDVVTWTYVITNTGNVTMSFAANSLKDDKEGVIPHAAFTLLPGESKTLTKQGTVTTVGVYTNMGSIPGVPDVPPPGTPDIPSFPPSVPPTTPITPTNPSHYDAVSAPAILLKKYTNGYDADTLTGPYLKTGSVVTWTYVITNIGDVTLTNITLTDDKLGGVNCPVNSLAPNATTTCTTTGIAGVGQYTNTAIVTGTNSLTPTQQVTSTNPSHYFGANPTVVLKKYTNGPGGTPTDADTLSDARPHLKLGDPVTWTYVITNTGNVPMSFAANSLKDDKEGVTLHAAFTLLPGERMTFTKQGMVTTVGVYTNTGSIPGVPDVPPPGTPDLPNFPPANPPTTPITPTNPSHYDAVGLSLGNRLWVDNGAGTSANRDNGIYDTGEPAAPQGIVVELLDITGTVLLTTTTDSNGYYRFDNLAVGSYQVRIPAREFAAGGKLAGYASSTGQTTAFATADNNRDHGDDAELNGVKSAVVTLGASNPTGDADSGATGAGSNGPSGDANDNLSVDFGFVPMATFGNFVWIESDGDGIASTGVITRVGGMVLTATDSLGLVYTTTTDPNGYYTFSVPAAVYTVTYGSVPSSYGAVVPSATSNSGAADKNNPGTDQASRPNHTVVSLTPGDNLLTIDFGFHAPHADLRLVKQTNKTRVQHGDTLVYTLVLTNDGPDDASAVKIADLLPSTVMYQGAVAQQGTYDSNTGLWDVGTVAANSRVTLTITVKVK